jgi:hypothetical protein
VSRDQSCFEKRYWQFFLKSNRFLIKNEAMDAEIVHTYIDIIVLLGNRQLFQY